MDKLLLGLLFSLSWFTIRFSIFTRCSIFTNFTLCETSRKYLLIFQTSDLNIGKPNFKISFARNAFDGWGLQRPPN